MPCRIGLLLAFSALFYISSNLFGYFLLILMAIVNYRFAAAFGAPGPLSSRTLFRLAIICNLLLLAWFKYSFFIVENLSLLLQTDWLFTPPELPPGISFYTFIQIAWLTGIYKGHFAPSAPTRHLVFSTCFPYILSGPIVRYSCLGPQLASLKHTSPDNLAAGFTMFTFGLAKKAILADSIASHANAVFKAAQNGWPLASLDAWLGSFCYSFQLYFDFSGYTDMALGLGLMLGLKLPENFNSPYKATGIIEFWRRWHITLGTWLRDFLYIPLGGNRKGKARQYLNLFLTMLLAGVWHGAGWTYILWGGMHGFMLCINHLCRSHISGPILAFFERPLVRLLSIAFTFFCINISWVVFRAPTLDCAWTMYQAMAGLPKAPPMHPPNYFTGWLPFGLLLLCAAICWLAPATQEIMKGQSEFFSFKPTRAWACSLAFLSALSLALLTRESTFLYFQF